MSQRYNKEATPDALAPNQPYGVTSSKISDIREALEQGDTKYILDVIGQFHAADIADVIDMLSRDERNVFLEIVGDNLDPEVLTELNSEVKEDILNVLGPKQSADAIGQLDTDEAIDVIEDLDDKERDEILQEIPEEKRTDLEERLLSPEDSAGRLLDNKTVSLPEYWSVGQTIDYLRSAEDLPKDFYQVFLLNAKGYPSGGVTLSRILRSNRDIKLHDIMETNLQLIEENTDQEEVAYIFRQYGIVSAPVVNDKGRMVGVINVDDVVHVIEEEAQEDIMRLAGVGESSIYSNFIKTLVSRFPWLLVNLITAVIASIVIAKFESTIAKLASLAVLMPIIASMGGNAGTQVLTVAVRAIAKKELTPANAWRVIAKEWLVGSVNGIIFAIISGILAYIWYDNMVLSVTFAAATVITLMLAGLSGAMIPLALERMGVDPAVASGVFLTTITDVVAFWAFLGLAATILL